MTTRLATCRCESLRVTCTGDPIRASMCHCFACQKRTGSIFGVQARFLATQVQAEGASSVYVHVGDSGGQAAMHFCPKCGSTVYWRYVEGGKPSDFIAVAVADPNFPAPKFTVYNNRKHPWAEMPGLVAESWD